MPMLNAKLKLAHQIPLIDVVALWKLFAKHDLMPLPYHPQPGAVLLCHYPEKDLVKSPEMYKSRPIIVVSPKLRRWNLVGVVPLSTTRPPRIEAYHRLITLPRSLPRYEGLEKWAKCDMFSVVSLLRIDGFRATRRRRGKPDYIDCRISEEQLKEVRAAILCSLGLSSLTVYL